MFNIDEITHNYILIEIFHYLESKKLLDKLLRNGISSEEVKSDEKLNFFFVFLDYKKIVFLNWDIFCFTSDFSENFLKLWYNKFLIFDWYKKFFDFSNYWEKDKDNKLVAEGSYYLSEKLYKDYFVNFINKNNINSLLDLWCWNWDFIIYLAQLFPSKFFYWIEIDKLTYESTLIVIEKLWLKNIKLYNENILNIDKIDSLNPDMIISFFVLHEINQVDNLISKIVKYLNPRFIIIREFTPPLNILNSDLYKNDQFFLTYIFIHFLTKQNTLLISEWENIFKNNWFILNYLLHVEKYNNTESMYPLLEFKRI